jgi:hypothetical protein
VRQQPQNSQRRHNSSPGGIKEAFETTDKPFLGTNLMNLRRYERNLKITTQIVTIGFPIIFVLFTITFFVAGTYLMYN